MNIFSKGLLLVAVPSLFQLLLLGMLVKAQMQATDAERSALHSRQIISEAADVLVPMLLESSRVFGAVITGDIASIEQAAVWSDLAQRLDHLEQLVADNPRQLDAIARMRRNVLAFRAWSIQSRELLQHEQETELVARFRNVAVQKELSEFRRELAAFQTEGVRIDRASAQLVRDSRLTQRATLAAAIAASLLTAALAAWVFSKGIAARLTTLTANAERLAHGQPLAGRVGGRDEISRLDHVLHDTAALLREAERRAALYRGELEQRATELAEANQHLRQQTLDNDMFVFSVSHDLRSPLVNMQGFSKELAHATSELSALLQEPELTPPIRQRMRDILRDDMQEALHFLQTAVLRTANIIDALLRLSRAGRLEYHLQPVDVASVVQRVIDAMQLTIRERGAQIIVHTLPPAWGDPTAVEQIFANLIGNAVNYLDPARPGRIEIGCLPGADETRLHTYTVNDNGLGIPAAYQAKAFGAFQRFHAERAKGEGVGLALVLRVVERQGGRVWFESTEAVGSTFFVALPAIP
ncbi:MAG: ATP-binding protein, partial [Pseudomonadota bacterium]|nr:ATP-binding protein [Pseudomonadota bacterium]